MLTSNTLTGRLFEHAATNPTRDAVVTPDVTLSYAQLAQLVQTQAQYLIDAGISSESVVGIKCADELQHLLLTLAGVQIGAISCTVPTYDTIEAQNGIVKQCHASRVVEQSSVVDIGMVVNTAVNSSSPTSVTPTKTAQLLFSTSGTTGRPKLVVHNDSDIVAQAHRHIESEHERFACLASIEHNFAKRHRLYCVAAGATNVFFNAAPEKLVAQIQNFNVNVLHVSAFQAQELLGNPDIQSLSNIRLKLGGSHVSLSLREKLRKNITHNLQAGYGTTETGAIAFTNAKDLHAGESVGQALPGIDIRVVSPERKPLPQGAHGELAIRCEGMFREYFENAAQTTARLENGWFYTGDIGYLDNEDRVHLCGRADDMFVFNSMNIYPQDIESQLCQYPDITDSAVLPKASPVHGNIPVALVVFREDVKPNLKALKKFTRAKLGVRSPRQFMIVDEIPRNSTGKISRHDVMDLSSDSEEVRRTLIDTLESNTQNVLKPSQVQAFINGEEDLSIRKIGLDSLARMELLITIEATYEVLISPYELGQMRSLGSVVSRVLALISQEKSNRHHDRSNHSNLPHNDLLSGNSQNNAQVVNKLPIDQKCNDTECHEPPPHIVQLFRRVQRFCATATALNRALLTLEHRLTPTEFACLNRWHEKGQLLPTDADPKFATATTYWLSYLMAMMPNSGKQEPEQFVARRISPYASLFIGPGPASHKRLVICFAAQGHRNLSIPNVVLMQHTDATQYDLLVLSDPLRELYRKGIPHIAKNINGVARWLGNLDIITHYKSIRTIGSSAGGYPAILAASLLGAELGVSVGGRFQRLKRHPLRFIGRIINLWHARYMGKGSRLILSYASDQKRDSLFAVIIARCTDGRLAAVEIADKNTGHVILRRLVDRGELGPYLAHTIYRKLEREKTSIEQVNTTIHFPGAVIK